MSTLTGVSKMDKERGNTISPIEADGDPYTFDLTSDDLEEMLAPAATFDVLEIPDTTVAEDFNEPPRQFNTADYGEHRKASYSFPHMHKPMMPLKGHHHRHRKKRSRANLREPTSTNSTQGALAGDVADATVTSTTRKHQSAPVMQSPAGDAITTTGSLSSMGGRVDSDTVPSDTEPVEGAPRIAEPVEGASRIAEPVEGAPRVAEPGEGASRVAHMSFVSEKPLSLRARHQAQFYVGSGTQLAEDIAEEEAEEMITLLNKEESDKAVTPPPPPVTIGSGEASQSDAATPPRKVSFVLGHSEASEASRLAGSDLSRKGSTDLRMSSADDDDMKDREDGLPRRRRIGVQHSEAPSIPEQQQSRRRKRSGQRDEMEQRRRKGSHVMFHNDNLLQRILEADMRGSDTLHETSDETDDEAGPLARHDALSCALRRTSTYQTGHRRRVSAAIHHHRPSVPGMMLQDEYIGPKPKKWDHIPHEIFAELDELIFDEDNEPMWKEMARWIKFEEDVQEGSDRWSKPRVPSLSFHSLLSLRKCIEEGMVLLDMHLLDYPSILDRVVNSMLLNDQVRKQDVEPLIHTLLLKHKWAGDNKFLPKNISFKNLAAIDLRKVSVVSLLDKRKPDSSRSSRKITNVPLYRDVEQGDKVSVTGTNQFPEQPPSKQTSELLKRIPEGAEGAAILVGTVSYLVKPTTVFVRLAQGTSMPALLEIDIPVRFLFILLGPATDGLDYHQIGRSIGALMVNQTFQGVAYTADGGQDLKVAINNFLDTSVVLPPGHWDKKTLVGIAEMQREEMEKQAVRKAKRQRHAAEKEDKQQEPVDPLSRTGRLFGGMINDMRHRYPQYKSDVVDAINAQCIATTIFIFFACLSPAITFGTILGEETEQWMGVTEMLVGSAFNGIVYALLAGQPLLVLGATGPILVFEYSLFLFCRSQDVEFLVFRWWVGSWILLFTLIVVALDGSALVRYFTRFTEEIFATLISFIFIFSCFKKLYYMYKYHPLLSLDDYCLTLNDSDPYDNETAANSSSYYADPINQPNTALIGTILMLGTFLLAYCLKLFRNSQFLGRSARRALGDFGVPIAIAMMTLIDIVLLHDTYTEKLYVPDGVSPSAPDKRGWFINPMGLRQPLQWYLVFAAAIPAFMIYILIFMEFQIAALIMNKKTRCLKKGTGYHLDICIIGVLAFFNGMLGLPWMVAATVRSLTHVSSLTVMSTTHAPGQKPSITDVKEQRVTMFIVSMLMGLCVLMAPVLRLVPESVLFGVFLYMGISSLKGIELVDRFMLMFKPEKHFPDVGYVRKVPRYKMNLYTAIQILCICLLWAVKSSVAALAFPFMLVLMVPVRKSLAWFYTPDELYELDKEDADAKDNDDEEPDFYEQTHMPI